MNAYFHLPAKVGCWFEGFQLNNKIFLIKLRF